MQSMQKNSNGIKKCETKLGKIIKIVSHFYHFKI